MGAVYLEIGTHGSQSGKRVIFCCPQLNLVLIRTAASANWIGVVVMGGFALVNNNKVTILVNEAELGSL